MWIIVVVMLSCRVVVFYCGMHHCDCMVGYISTYVIYTYRCSMFGCDISCWLHSCMLGCMYHSCRFDFKYCSFMLDHTCLCICVDGYASLMHVHV